MDPTIERVRAELGTGSNTTISKYLKEWRELNDQELKTPVSLKISSQLLTVAQSLWDTAKTQAETEANIIKEEAHQKVIQAETQLNEKSGKIKALHEKLQHAEEALTHQVKLKDKLSLEVAQERQDNAILKSQMMTMDNHLTQQKEENVKLHQLSQSLQRNWEHLERTSQEQQEKLKSELENLRQQSEHQTKQLILEVQQLTHEKQSLQGQIDEIKNHHNQLQSENLELHKQLERKTFEINSLRTQINQLNIENNNLHQQINKNQTIIHAAEIKTTEIIIENKNLNGIINQLKGKVQLLDSKNKN